MAGDTLTVTLSTTDNPNATLYGYATDNNRSAAVFNGVIQGPVDQLTYVKNRLAEMIGAPVTISGVDATTDLITASGAHGLVANDPVRIKALGAGAVPGGLSAGTVYYVLFQSTTTVKLALTPGGSAVDITSAGTGPLYLYKIPDAGTGLYVVTAGEAAALSDAVVLIEGTQSVTGAKTFADITLAGTSWIKTVSRSVARVSPLPWVNGDGVASYAGLLIDGGGGSAEKGLDLPHGQVLTSVTVRITPAPVVSLPTPMPTIEVIKTSLVAGSDTTIGVVTDDPSLTVGAYNATHDITISGLAETIDLTAFSYRVVFANAGGTSPANDVLVIGAKATCTVTGQREWV